MARWFVMDRRVASELKKNYFFICCRPPVRVRDSLLTYWEALAGERMSRHFSLLPFVSCFPDFYCFCESCMFCAWHASCIVIVSPSIVYA